MEDISQYLLEKAITIALEGHQGQKDKAGEAYILHPLTLMLRFSSNLERAVAVLHDVVEDAGVSLDFLRDQGFDERVVSAVDRLSRRPEESYEVFIENIAKCPLATSIKIQDLEHNMDVRRLSSFSGNDAFRMRRYVLAWNRLKCSIRNEET